MSNKERPSTFSPSYDKNPDQRMIDAGWRINRYGEWSKPADVYISQEERRRILEIMAQDKTKGEISSVDEDLDAPSDIDTLTQALKGNSL